MAAPSRFCVLLVVTALAAAASGQLCNRYAPQYSVVASQRASGPWEAALDVARHAPSQRLHFAVRPARSDGAEELTLTLKGRLPLGELEAVDDDYEAVSVVGAGGGERWYKVHAARVTWAEARAVCEAERAHLLVVDSPDEAAAISTLLSRHAHAISRELHAGFYAKDYAGSFYTVHGKALSASGYEGWGPGQPDMSICGRVDHAGRLRDGMCEWVEPASFVCEREAASGPRPGARAAEAEAPGPAPPPPRVPGPPPAGYREAPPHGGASLYRLHATPANWWDAEARCQEEGAHLAVFNSESEARVLGELLDGDHLQILPYVYVGVRAELFFITIFGKSVSDEKHNLWAPDYPAFTNCVAANHNGTLWVTQCWAKYPFLCEYDAH